MRTGRRIITAAAAATLVGGAAIARRGVPDWERRAYRMINDSPDQLAPVAWLPMQAGSLTAPFAVAAWTFHRTRRADPAVAYATAGFVTWLAAKAVKKVVGRGRPFDYDPATNLRLATRTDGSLGYVSGHAAVATTIAVVMGHRRSLPAALALHAFAQLVGVTRIYAGAHFPLDTVGGSALGMIIGEAANTIRDGLDT